MKGILMVDGERDIGAFIISIIISVGTGILASVFAGVPRIMYQSFNKPFFAPPGWIFPIVWTILYLLMGLAVYRIYLVGKSGQNIKCALIFYGIQLILNFIWPIIFFRFDLKSVAFFELLVLMGFIIITMVEFFKADKKAGYLLIPYFIWTVFASVLNYSIWMLNM
ncbi:tryptophan-rich sensory protein [Clostridium aestuarii]|uniref:Tryptophan-rich sensory protein n=1 Tax=Clostridium aestuarii TaxID=338193 RepID=A0ABT4D1R2_9CLOT|nr:TspO/MBR family protein [Clostridium aestuarii]MCY6485188.1 tryptophan-rich sensory protein [Clostridium aestuarii]